MAVYLAGLRSMDLPVMHQSRFQVQARYVRLRMHRMGHNKAVKSLIAYDCQTILGPKQKLGIVTEFSPKQTQAGAKTTARCFPCFVQQSAPL